MHDETGKPHQDGDPEQPTPHPHQHTPPHARSTRAPAETSWNCLSGSVLPRSLDLTVVNSVDLFPLAVQGKVGPAGNHSAGSRGNRRLENRGDVSATGSCQRNGHTSPTSATAPSPPRNRKLSLPQSAGLEGPSEGP